MKCAIEMGSGAMMYLNIPSFIKTGSDIQKFVGGGGGIHRKQGDLMNLIPLFSK
jgi:hypothetical protein